ncbi:hypothetical protein PoB_001403800 [Plakobranchus ocellatus]|uniref:HAT C-terminal dimerisation domain-containing protein n=1 Tax=Plakobranchus ocellatus TaxID=259542 RepID=A0AAV3YZ73_9GAST|nr:hypothetical protein PoB_001403800 [Plakobranchus ocellatus]
MEWNLPVAGRKDEVWAHLATQDEDCKFVCLFLLKLLVPRSSASCGRVFSHVRKILIDQRSVMGIELLEALVIYKHIPESVAIRILYVFLVICWKFSRAHAEEGYRIRAPICWPRSRHSYY